MRRLRLICPALAVGLGIVGALAVAASATTLETLPSLGAGETRAGTGKSLGSVEFRTASPGIGALVCGKIKGEGIESSSSPPEGTWHSTSEECTTKVLGNTVKCTGLGDSTAGTILLLGTWVGVFDREKGKAQVELTTAVLRRNEATHFSCSIVLVEELPGEALCLVVKPTEKAFTHEIRCLGPASGTEQVEEWSADETTWHVPVLTAGVNHPTKHEPAIGIGSGTITTLVELFGDV